MPQTTIERKWVRLASDFNRRARSLGVHGRLTSLDLYDVFKRSWSEKDQEYQCVYCGIGIDALYCSFDHIASFSQGGQNDTSNLNACCISCQRNKFTKTPEELAIYRALWVDCLTCQKRFKPRWADWKAGNARYCSRSCSGVAGGHAAAEARA